MDEKEAEARPLMGTIFLVVKAADCLGNYGANNPRTCGLTPSDSDRLQHNFLAAVL